MFFRKSWVSIKNIVAKNKLAITLFILASFLRLYRFNDFVTFLGDQGRDATIIKRILNFEHFPLIGAPSSIGQIFLGPFYYYLIAPFLLIFNYHPIGLAYAVFFLSLIALITACFILKKEINYKTSIYFLIFITFSLVNIDFSRYSWNPNLLPVFAFFTLYFFNKFLTKNNLIYAVLFGSFLSFSIQLHYLALLLIIPTLAAYFYYLWTIKFNNLYIKNIIVSLVTFIVCSSPLILFDFRHNFLNSRNLFKLFTQGEVVSSSSFLFRFMETNQSFLNVIFKLNINSILALIITLCLLIASFIVIFKKKHFNLFLQINYFNLVFFLVLFALLNSPRNPHYFGPIYYSFFFILAYILSRSKNFVYFYLLVPLLIIFYIGFNAKNYYFLYNQPNNQIQKARIIAESIAENITSYPFQTVSLPYFETDGHVRYFLEISNNQPLPLDSPSQPTELFVLCFENNCEVLNNPQWQVAAFKNKKIDKIWTVEGVKIYKVIHK